MEIRSAYQPHERSQISFKHPSLAKQSSAEECDINTIMKKFSETGLIDHVNQYQGQYGNFTEVEDYQTSLNRVIAARDAFESLPSGIRSRFNNNPGAFLEFTDNPENESEMRTLGLLPKEKAPEKPAEPPKVAHEGLKVEGNPELPEEPLEAQKGAPPPPL